MVQEPDIIYLQIGVYFYNGVKFFTIFNNFYINVMG